MNTIKSLCFGGRESVDQTLSGIYSAYRFLPSPPPDFQIVVYPDVPERFRDVPARVIELTPSQVKA